MRKLLFLAGIALTISAPLAFAAPVVNPAVFSENIYGTLGEISSAPDILTSDVSNTFVTVSGSAATNASLAPSADLQVTQAFPRAESPPFTAAASASVQYYLTIMGPPDVLTPLIFQTVGSAMLIGDTNLTTADAVVTVTGSSNDPSSNFTIQGSHASPMGFQFNQTVTHTYYSDTAISVNMIVELVPPEPSIPEAGSVSAMVALDPTIEIDPSFPQASEFSLLFSANLPEPAATAATLIIVAAISLGRHQRTLANGIATAIFG